MNSALTRMINLLKMIKEPIGGPDQEFITMLETVCEECKSVSSDLEISVKITSKIRGLRVYPLPEEDMVCIFQEL